MPGPEEFNFTDASRLGIVQARFEALSLGIQVIDPGHLVLGVTKTLGQTTFDRLFPDRDRFASLCHALGAAETAASASATDVTYSEEAIEAISGAMRTAGASAAGVTPLHLLLGIHQPWMRSDAGPGRVSFASALLDGAGLAASQLEEFVADMEAGPA